MMSRQAWKMARACAEAAAIALLLGACGSGNEDSIPDGQASERVVAATVAEAASMEVRDELYSVGRVVSRNTPMLAAEINARVVEVLVDEGEAVREGQVLLRLDRTSFELAKQEAQANIQRLTISIENEQRRVARYRDLKAKDMMPQERLDDAEAQLDVDKASLAAAVAQLAVTLDRLAKTELVSPVNGMVEKRLVSVGDYVQAGGALVAVTDTVNLRIEMPFPETLGSRLETGQVMLVESPLAPGLVVEVVVDEILPQVSAMNQSLMVVSQITNPGPWRPQATVEGVLVVETRSDAIVVPSMSVVKRPAGDVVYRLLSGAGDTVEQVVVATGLRKDGWTEITEGLAGGDRVVVEGAPYLTDGARIAVQETEG
jgi:RND family efflux transporter MFP subunit